MQVTVKGQITIPQGIREQFGFLPHTEIEFIVEGKKVYLRKLSKYPHKRGVRMIERMRGSATVKLTTNEIMALTRGK